ncbi:MAG: DNA translocase FtsK, partial [Chthoniobacterales bacterium]|nr:DNA translocase FtsK [Chthoniobacterales bacterium]
TRYEIYPARGIRVDRIAALERDIARATKAERINILAPIPGKDTVGIEIANTKKVKVILRELLESEQWLNTKARLPLALGKDVYGNTLIGDLSQMPHCLIAGTTGSGKSVCINAIVASLLFRHSPEDLRFIMIDPKVVELQLFNRLPHLVTPVVTDPKKVLLALKWVIEEMELRYKIFAQTGVRNISSFNSRALSTDKEKTEKKKIGLSSSENQLGKIGSSSLAHPLNLDLPTTGNNPETTQETSDPQALHLSTENFSQPHSTPNISEPPPSASHSLTKEDEDDVPIPERMPYIVVIIDELADLMQTAPADVEAAIARITQMARAAGIHMIVATQTPRADVVTGIIKANIPTRIAFQVASKVDSRVILDTNGAEKLLGQGDMLYQPPGTSKLIRAQGVLVTDEEMRRIVDFVASQGEPAYEASIHERLSSDKITEEDVTPEDEELVARCLEIIKQERKASTSMLQRRLRLGYTRAARVVDILEMRGILGPKDGAKDREILVDLDSL